MALTKVTGQVINDSTGLVVGVTTVGGGLSATDGFFSGIVTAVGNASFSGNVSVGGTLTYEDVTNIDAVGLVTARDGIVVGSGITLSKDGDVFFTGIATGNGSGLTALNASNLASGTVPTARLGSGTASSSTFLRGDSTFAAVTSTTINNNADNRVITGSGSANTLEGEATLTYNGTDTFELQPASATPAIFVGDSNRTGAGQGLAQYRGNWNGTTVARMTFDTGDDTTNKDDGIIRFDTAPSGSLSERLRIGSAGQLGIAGANYGTSGQVLSSQGSSSAIQWAVPGLIYEGNNTSLPTDAGEVDVDVILSTAKRIEIFIFSYSVNSSNGEFILRLRTSSGTISGNVYKGSGHYLSNTSYATSAAHTTGFKSMGLGDSSANYSGHFVLKNVNSNTWFCNGDFWNDSSATGYWISGHVDAGATVTGVTLRNASGSFDAGTYKIIQYNTL